jgi:general stress protein YciG
MAEKGKRGFAAMDREKQRQIASMGGKAAHRKGTAHEFTPEEAREAGRKGGQAAHERGKAHVFTPEEAREAGRKGGQNSHARRSARTQQQPAPELEPPEETAAVAEGISEYRPEVEPEAPASRETPRTLPVENGVYAPSRSEVGVG